VEVKVCRVWDANLDKYKPLLDKFNAIHNESHERRGANGTINGMARPSGKGATHHAINRTSNEAGSGHQSRQGYRLSYRFI
jgi:hypothetical protein